MAKITFGPSLSEARGKAADTVYTKTRGGNVAKALSLTAGGVGPHNLLSVTHPDTTPATPPARGSLITGQAALTLWKELLLGAANKVLLSDGTDAVWGDFWTGSPITCLSGKVGIGATTPANLLSIGQDDQGFSLPSANRLGVIVFSIEVARWSNYGLELGPAIGTNMGDELALKKLAFLNDGTVRVKDSAGTIKTVIQFFTDDNIYLNALTGGSFKFRTSDLSKTILTLNNDGSITLYTPLTAANGGTENGFTAFTGPAATKKTFTLPNASAAILTDNTPVTVAQGGTGTTNGSITGTTELHLAAGGSNQNVKLSPSGTGNLVIQGVQEYADNAAAITAGVPTGGLYRTGDLQKIVH